MEDISLKLFELLSKSTTTSQQLQKFIESNSRVKLDFEQNEIVEYLNDKKETPLIYALRNGREDLAIVLLDTGANPNTNDKSTYVSLSAFYTKIPAILFTLPLVSVMRKQWKNSSKRKQMSSL
jgi:hypothetical protein